MQSLTLVALGGALGSVARWALSGWVLHLTPGWRFPAGTFAVNLMGCLIIGVLGGLAVKHDFFSTDARLFLFTGLCGGFTTFSAFGLETFYLLRRNEAFVAGGYVAASVVLGLAAVWMGFALVTPRAQGGIQAAHLIVTETLNAVSPPVLRMNVASALPPLENPIANERMTR